MRAAWIPDYEAYCRTCHRMVAATVNRVLLSHYRFAQSDDYAQSVDYLPCKGRYTLPDMTHGMEDSVVEFWPTHPDTYPEPEAAPEPPAVPDDSAAKVVHPA